MIFPREAYGQQPAVGQVPPRITPHDRIPLPLPRKPIPNLPAPPDDEHDTPEAWAEYAAELFRQRADWRMCRTAASIAEALAAATIIRNAEARR